MAALVVRQTTNLLHEREAVDLGHADVGDHDVRTATSDLGQRLPGARDAGDDGPAIREHVAQEMPRVFIVVDDEKMQVIETDIGRAVAGGEHWPTRSAPTCCPIRVDR